MSAGKGGYRKKNRAGSQAKDMRQWDRQRAEQDRARRREIRRAERADEVMTRTRFRCPEPCGKIQCDSEEDARWLKGEISAHKTDDLEPVRFYRSNSCGYWHWTRKMIHR